MKQYDKARADYDKAIEILPDVAFHYMARANLLYSQGNITQAFEDYSLAIDLEPKNSDLHDRIGNIFFNCGKDEKAFEHFSKAIRYSQVE